MRRDQNFRFNVIRDVLRHYSDDLVVHCRKNPVLITFNGINISIYLANVVPERKTSERIDIKRANIDDQKKYKSQGYDVAFVGIHKTFGAFSVWHPDHALSLQTSTNASLAVRKLKHHVQQGQPLVYVTKPKSVNQKKFVITMNSMDLGYYLENINMLHSMTSEAEVIEAMNVKNQGKLQSLVESSRPIDIYDNGFRRMIKYTGTSYERSAAFRETVLSAYDNSCCMCGRQLGIVEAAHIVPHNDERSSDVVTNGLALCVEHHKLYDTGLLLPTPEYTLLINNNRANYLRTANLDKCLDDVMRLEGKCFTLPKKMADWPTEENLRIGLKIRLDS